MPTIYAKTSGRSFVCFCCLLIGFAFVTPLSVLAQLIDRPAFLCATESLSPADRRALEAEAILALRLKQASGASFTTLTYIPIRPHIIRKTDGTGGYTMASLNNVLALTNKYYLQNGNGIQFYFAGTTPDYIDNDALYTQYRQNVDDATVAPRDVNNALNQYYIHSFDNANLGGYARFPSNDVASTRTIILDENSDGDMGNRLVPHELGHTFNLLHTFEPFYGYERVTRGTGANCTTAGDLVCDTPADPYGRYAGATNACISGCPPNYTCSFTDDQGNLYTPSPTNIMSYYQPCIYDFTAGQYDRIQAGLATRQAHTAYTLDAPATTMTAPSNVVASISGGAIVISWQDNASNEMGYFIERSTLPAAGFAPIGGVAPGVTTFIDRSFASRSQYYYRVKASNTTTGSISPTATIVAPDCRPSFTSDGCQFAINITAVTVNSTVLSQSSGCSPSSSGYYTAFTAVSGTVTAGQSATFTVTKGTFNAMGGAIWVDLNNNNIFETSERLYQMPTTNTSATFSGTMVIPAGTAAGTVAMRVVAAYAVIPTDPCGSYGYGETEDYILVIKPACSTPVASLSGTTTITSGQTATLTASLIGTPPFSLTVNASSSSPTTFTGIAASPFSFTVAPIVSTTYTLEQVAGDCGTGTVSGTAVVTVNACTTMYTLKTGAWNDPTVWSCNHLPTEIDLVEVGHLVTIPSSFVARALQVKYTASGRVSLDSTAKLRLGP
ncbi:GEVED domain-containing protein [Spirosoma flavum]|uniref:GEVED domain-containing protein n=1 Tax=Spirosoma flavum TaxID=2048557 RepID=A0ABW6AQX1_9BACT